MFILAAEYPFLEIVGTIIVFFAWIAWIFILVTVLSDLFRRHDISGWGKAAWVLFVIVIPFLGVLFYLGSQGRHMAERNAEAAKAQQSEFDAYVKKAAGGSGSGLAAEIAHAKELLDGGAITQAEFDQLKQKELA